MVVERLEPVLLGPDRHLVVADGQDIELAALGGDVGGDALAQHVLLEHHPAQVDAGVLAFRRSARASASRSSGRCSPSRWSAWCRPARLAPASGSRRPPGLRRSQGTVACRHGFGSSRWSFVSIARRPSETLRVELIRSPRSPWRDLSVHPVAAVYVIRLRNDVVGVARWPGTSPARRSRPAVPSGRTAPLRRRRCASSRPVGGSHVGRSCASTCSHMLVVHHARRDRVDVDAVPDQVEAECSGSG